MLASVPDSVGSKATLLSNWVQVAYRAMRLYGLDADDLLNKSDIDLRHLCISGERILSHKVRRLWRMGADAYGNDAFGIKAAEAAYPGMYYSLSIILSTCGSLGEMLQKLMRYRRVVDTISVNTYEVGPEYAKFTWSPVVNYESQVGAEAWVACFIQLYRWAAGENVSPARVTLHRPGVERPEIYWDFFRAPIDFDSEENALYFSADSLDLPLLGANSTLLAHNEQLTATYLSRLLRGDMINSVYSQILSSIELHAVSVNRVAEELSMSTRTLQRKLKASGTSFESLLNDVRRERALQYIQSNDYSVQEIGHMLGFSDLSNFSRAFRRWTAMSPTEYRKMTHYT